MHLARPLTEEEKEIAEREAEDENYATYHAAQIATAMAKVKTGDDYLTAYVKAFRTAFAGIRADQEQGHRDDEVGEAAEAAENDRGER